MGRALVKGQAKSGDEVSYRVLLDSFALDIARCLEIIGIAKHEELFDAARNAARGLIFVEPNNGQHFWLAPEPQGEGACATPFIKR